MTLHTKTLYSWGRRKTSGSKVLPLSWRGDLLPSGAGKLLPYGMGRSYGDSCLLDDGCQIETVGLDHLIAFDAGSGVIRCEAGCTIASLLEFAVPRGWFVPVSPGTKFVTLGGCLANDVHGKNHHTAGTFGCFVTRFGLRRSDGLEMECSPGENSGLFHATIGGLGLTGLILWVELKLKRIFGPFIRQRMQRLKGLDSFFEVARREDNNVEYSVAWLDAGHAGDPRGLFIAGNHCSEEMKPSPYSADTRLSLPVVLPDFAMGTWSINLMNTAFYQANAHRSADRTVHIDPFFYPLDAVGHWNRAYGKKGLAQYQFVVPMEHGPEALSETLGKVQASRQTSFLTVVKLFGSVPSPGLLSFPRPGVTVCFDFPFLGERTLKLLDDLDRTVFSCGGALYPAKDFRMSRESFERSFPRHQEFKQWIDPAFSSNFAQRTGLTT